MPRRLNPPGDLTAALLMVAAAVASVALAVGGAGPVAAGVTHSVPSTMVESPEPDCNAGVDVERTAWLMGTGLRIRVCAPDRASGVSAIEGAFRAVREVEGRLSTWLPDSELSRLNDAAPDTWVDTSPSTAALLREVRAWVEATDGAFDPAVGGSVAAWDLQGEGRVPDETELAAAISTAGPAAWAIDPERPQVRRLLATRLDAGGFGKGAGLRAAADSLAGHAVSSAMLDFGGQLLILGDGRTARREVAVAHPLRRDEPVLSLRVGNVSAATSSASERHVETSVGTIGHVLDPRTGHSIPPWGSVTVLAEDPLVADVLSTALFVMGPVEALRWSRERTDVGVLVLELDSAGGLVVRLNPGLRGMVTFDIPASPEL